MIVRMIRGKGKSREEWLIRTCRDTEEEAREVAEAHAPSNGEGWIYDGIEHPHTLPAEREPAEPE